MSFTLSPVSEIFLLVSFSLLNSYNVFKKKKNWRNALKSDCLAKKTVVMQSGMGLEWGEEYLGNVAVLKQEVNLK